MVCDEEGDYEGELCGNGMFCVLISMVVTGVCACELHARVALVPISWFCSCTTHV